MTGKAFSDVALVALPTFQPPSTHAFEINAVLFGDLLSQAPRLNTSATDVMAVVEAENVAKISNLKSQISNPSAGRIEDAARAFIEKSRSRGWESITLPGREGEAGITVHYDGQGRHVEERVVSEGLREYVVCDGSTLWHVYREIGLASKRPFRRFHHREFTAIVPWLLPDADELARGADVVAVDEHMLMTLHSMSVQMRELGNTNIADQMMTLLLASLDAKGRPDVSLCAIEQLRRMKDPRAEKLLDQVMELPIADQVPGLWRFASKLAEDSGERVTETGDRQHMAAPLRKYCLTVPRPFWIALRRAEDSELPSRTTGLLARGG